MDSVRWQGASDSFGPLKVKIRIFFENFRLQIPEKDSEG
jgi:hypothetical protein